MDHSPHPPSHALSFGAVAETYDRSRPGYPREAVEWLVRDGIVEWVDKVETLAIVR